MAKRRRAYHLPTWLSTPKWKETHPTPQVGQGLTVYKVRPSSSPMPQPPVGRGWQYTRDEMPDGLTRHMWRYVRPEEDEEEA